jgi:hypothetical protein
LCSQFSNLPEPESSVLRMSNLQRGSRERVLFGLAFGIG